MKKPITLLFLHLLFSLSLLGQDFNYISNDEAKSDFEYLQKTFEEVHYNPYFFHSKDSVEAFMAASMEAWSEDSITYRTFVNDGMKLAAMMSGGHSALYWKVAGVVEDVNNHQFLPISGTISEDGNHFLVNRSLVDGVNPGDTVDTINGQSAVQLFENAMQYTGGITAFRASDTETMFPFYLFFNASIKAPYVLKTPSGEELGSTEGVPFEGIANFVNERAVTEKYTFEILEEEIGLISYNSCTDYSAFKKFLKSTFRKIESKKIDKLIIDIRQNGGGDSSLNDLLIAYISKSPYRQMSGRYWKVSQQSKDAYSSEPVYEKLFGKEFMDSYLATANGDVIEEMGADLQTPDSSIPLFEGKTCVLIGPNTFSSANMLADAVKTYQVSTLIGQATGENTNDFGEQLSFQLPNSGATVFVSSTYDIGADGDASLLKPVHPDVEVDGDALEFALEWMRNPQ